MIPSGSIQCVGTKSREDTPFEDGQRQTRRGIYKKYALIVWDLLLVSIFSSRWQWYCEARNRANVTLWPPSIRSYSSLSDGVVSPRLPCPSTDPLRGRRGAGRSDTLPGRTIPPVVIDIAPPPLWRSLPVYVATSRAVLSGHNPTARGLTRVRNPTIMTGLTTRERRQTRTQ